MKTTLDRLLESISPEKTIEQTYNRANEAIISFDFDKAKVESWEEFKYCMAKFLKHLDERVLKLKTPLDVPLTALGICEGTHRYEDPMKIAEYVGKTTVYTYQEIQEMCSQPVLAIRFRLVRILDVAVTLDEMRVSGVLAGAPQSISQLSSRVVDWLRGRIGL